MLPQKLKNNNFLFLEDSDQPFLNSIDALFFAFPAMKVQSWGRNSIASLRCKYPNMGNNKEAFGALCIVEVFLVG